MNILQEHIQTLRTIWIALELPGQIAFSGIFALWLYGWMKLAIKYHHKKKQAKKEFQQCNYKQPQCTVRTCLNKDKPNEYAFGGGISSCPIRYTLTDAERKELKTCWTSKVLANIQPIPPKPKNLFHSPNIQH